MALKKCSECGHGVSTKAATCPNCGTPIKAVKKKGCGCLPMLILLGLVIALVIKVNQYANSPEARAAAEARKNADLQAATQQAAKEQMDRKVEADARAKLRNDAKILTVNQVVAFYAANEVAGDEKLKGRVFKVEGVVERVGKDMTGQAYVAVKSDTPLRTVQCFFTDAHQSDLRNLRRGQSIVVFGTCKGLMMNVLMDDCELCDQ